MQYKHGFRQENALFAIEGVNTIWEDFFPNAPRLCFPKNCEISDLKEHYFYLLTSGSVLLSCLAEDGQDRGVMLIGPGMLLGEVGKIHFSDVHVVSLRTRENCEVIQFPTAILDDDDFYVQHPKLAKNLVRSLAIKAGVFFVQLFDSGLVPVNVRVSRTIHRLWQENGKENTFCPAISQSEMAEMLGIHRSSLCRVINSLRNEGIIGVFTKSKLEIFDAEKLLISSEYNP